MYRDKTITLQNNPLLVLQTILNEHKMCATVFNINETICSVKLTNNLVSSSTKRWKM